MQPSQTAAQITTTTQGWTSLVLDKRRHFGNLRQRFDHLGRIIERLQSQNPLLSRLGDGMAGQQPDNFIVFENPQGFFAHQLHGPA
jgi:hypothetical protein